MPNETPPIRQSAIGNRQFLVVHWCLVIGAFVVMCAATWLRWPDPIVDFGRELYVPWQITQGKVLYRDIAHFNGPLSMYFNAMVFAVLGVSLRSLVIVNLLILAAVTAMIWRLWSRMADEFAATTACVVLPTVFAFIQLVGIGNYNFVTPYSHELTHGIALSLAAIMFVETYARRSHWKWLAAAGLCLGLVFLTKIEVFLAAAMAAAVGVILCKPSGRSLCAFAISLLIPPLVAFVFLRQAMSATDAVRGVLGSWLYVFNSRIHEMPLYRRTLGTENLANSFMRIGACIVAYAVAVVPAVVLGFVLRRFAAAAWLVLLAGAVVAAVVFGFVEMNVWQNSLRGLAIVLPVMAVGLIVLARRFRSPRKITAAVVCVFAAALLAKIFLNVRAYHYGFALAMPATLVAIAAAVNWLPAWISRRGGSAAVARAAIVPLVAVLVFVHLYVYGRFYAPKQNLVGTGADAFRSDTSDDRRGLAVKLMMQQLATLPRDATLAVLPEGVMLNFLSRRTNPTPYVSVMPPEIAMFGMEQITRAFDEHPPDYIVLVNLPNAEEYGAGDFKTGFGAEIYQWISANYQDVPMSQGPGFPMTLLKRK